MLAFSIFNLQINRLYLLRLSSICSNIWTWFCGTIWSLLVRLQNVSCGCIKENFILGVHERLKLTGKFRHYACRKRTSKVWKRKKRRLFHFPIKVCIFVVLDLVALISSHLGIVNFWQVEFDDLKANWTPRWK